MYLWLGLFFSIALADVCPEYLSPDAPRLLGLSRFARDPQKILNELSQQKLDVAVEAEIPIDPKLIAQMTTTTGTLRPLFGSRIDQNLELPKSVQFRAQIQGIDVLDVSWSELTFEERREVLVLANTDSDFDHRRKIRGLQMSQKPYGMNFWRASGETFLGQWYPRGRHQIDLSNFLLRDVEFGTPWAVQDLNIFELHFRARRSAGQLARDAWIFERGLGLKKTALHVHIPFSLPPSDIGSDIRVFELADFIRRVNLVAEMVVFMEDGASIPEKSEDEISGRSYTDYESLTSNGFRNLIRKIQTYKDHTLRDRERRLASVTLRWPGTYSDRRLLGLEFRAITQVSQPHIVAPLLDTIQAYVLRFRNRPTSPAFRAWYRWFQNQNQYQSKRYLFIENFSNLWYNHSDMTDRFAPQSLKPLVKRYLGMKQHENFPADSVEQLVLIHDWTKDSVLFNQPELQHQVLMAQQKAIEFLIENPDEQKSPVIRKFLRDSGLYRAFLLSMGDW